MPEKLTHEEIARQAKQLYETELRAILEPTHQDEFVTIEPVSRTYYLGKTFSEAVQKAKQSCPGFLSFTLRVGYRAALHLGVVAREVEASLIGVTMMLGHRLVVDCRLFQVELN